jgi:hypothetical protein
VDAVCRIFALISINIDLLSEKSQMLILNLVENILSFTYFATEVTNSKFSTDTVLSDGNMKMKFYNKVPNQRKNWTRKSILRESKSFLLQHSLYSVGEFISCLMCFV